MLDHAAYRTYVTGYPEGIVRTVENPASGDSFDFAGYADGHLIDTIFSLQGLVGDDGRLVQRAEERFLGVAEAQMAAAGAYPIRWVCQQPGDAEVLARFLAENGPVFAKLYPQGRISVGVIDPEDPAEQGIDARQ